MRVGEGREKKAGGEQVKVSWEWSGAFFWSGRSRGVRCVGSVGVSEGVSGKVVRPSEV